MSVSQQKLAYMLMQVSRINLTCFPGVLEPPAKIIFSPGFLKYSGTAEYQLQQLKIVFPSISQQKLVYIVMQVSRIALTHFPGIQQPRLFRSILKILETLKLLLETSECSRKYEVNTFVTRLQICLLKNFRVCVSVTRLQIC